MAKTIVLLKADFSIKKTFDFFNVADDLTLSLYASKETSLPQELESRQG